MIMNEGPALGAMKRLISAALLVAAACSTSAATEQVRVIDGDTLSIGAVTYRLHGIDAPEVGQRCSLPSGKSWQCGRAALDRLEALVAGKHVTCSSREQDGYGRTIGVCYAGSTEINQQLVLDGLAWAFRKYSTDYVAEEDRARSARLGVWQAATDPAWIYREKRWADGASKAPDGCPIKGNISRNGRIYHAPWSPWYTRTKVSPNKGERWFCSEAEAVKAGWRAPIWGN